MRYKVHPEHKPKFKIGQKVWCIYAGMQVESTDIQGIRFELVNHSGKELLMCVGYHLSLLNANLEAMNLDTLWPAREVYATEQEAQELAKWYPVEGISKKDWTKAIGNNKDDISKENSELPPCCGEISWLREMLMKCRKDKGLIERDVRKLKKVVKPGSHLPNAPIPTLRKIFEKLDIKI